jgi:hypothetical protein
MRAEVGATRWATTSAMAASVTFLGRRVGGLDRRAAPICQDHLRANHDVKWPRCSPSISCRQGSQTK